MSFVVALRRLVLEEYAKHPSIEKSVLFLSSHFYSRLRMGKGVSVAERLKDGYKNVSTWLTRADLFSRHMVFIPINKEYVCRLCVGRRQRRQLMCWLLTSLQPLSFL